MVTKCSSNKTASEHELQKKRKKNDRLPTKDFGSKLVAEEAALSPKSSR